MRKSDLKYSGIILILVSIFIYFTKGKPYVGNIGLNDTFVLHLFWSLVTFILGFGFIILSVLKDQ